jgi:hypothetical protein
MRRSQELLVGIALLAAFWLIWNRLRIHVWVRLSGFQLLVLFGVLALAIFLVLEHLVNRTR